ncbi:alpha/beta-hydrolase [Amniculicola lignicola CBS 123094]|uniref:Alpha/beta-hydrolase n=1 Tax=Amniculicola lignicola CBS 123094 TaxID=1392246 RepID=A0A6A5WXY2_9PLEO|nr:alpha/beta-hydrolase [Amniculicola lignicola CBS 123094]
MAASEPVIRNAYVDTAFGQVHYCYSQPLNPHSTPPKSIPILLLHMSASSSISMQKLMRLLTTSGYNCYAPDMPGFGNSSNPPSDPPNIAWYADLYHTLFSAVQGFEKGCHVLGHHSGGVISTELASGSRYNSFVRSLTCIGPTVMTAEQRREMAKTFGAPFNKPVASGAHLLSTWEYLIWEGLNPATHLDLIQRELLDHVRAWEGRSQIYSCVWDYDCEAALKLLRDDCKVLALCARDDVLWPYFEQFKATSGAFETMEIQGGNFGPDLDGQGIVDAFLPFIEYIQ